MLLVHASAASAAAASDSDSYFAVTLSTSTFRAQNTIFFPVR
jgi:hypothetical protein